jgi:uncharacterized protein (DUF885 family)
LAETKKFLQRLERINTAGFSEQEAVNKALMAHNLRDNIEDIGLKQWEMPVTQISGIHLNAAQLPSLLPFATTKDYDDYTKRLHNFPKQMDDTIANMRKGMRDRLMPPKFLLEKVVKQAAGIAAQEPEDAIRRAASKFPDAVPESEARLRTKSSTPSARRCSVVCEVRRVREEDYAPPAGRTSACGPDGAKRYASRVRQAPPPT